MTEDNRFTDMEQASRSGLIEKGWIPLELPRSAHDLRLRHVPSMNYVWMRFGFDPAHETTFHAMEEVRPDEVTIRATPRVSRWPASWWPHSLHPERVAEASGDEFTFYCFVRTTTYGDSQITSRQAFFAVRRDSPVAYYWEPGLYRDDCERSKDSL